MPATDWRDVKYDEVFSDILAGLERRRHHDVAFVVSDAEGVLRDLYVQDGNDMALPAWERMRFLV